MSDLNETIEATYAPSALKVEDITDKIQDVLSDKAKEVLNTAEMAKQTLVEKDHRIHDVKTISVSTVDSKVGAMLLARKFNDLVEKYDISLLLSKPCQMDLVEPLTLEMAKNGIEPKRTYTVSFLMILLPFDIKIGQVAGDIPELYQPTQEEIEEAHKLIKD